MMVKIGNQTLEGQVDVKLNYPGVGAGLIELDQVLDYAAASVILKASGTGMINQSIEIGIRQLLLSSIRVEQYVDFYLQARTDDPKWDSMERLDAPWYDKKKAYTKFFPVPQQNCRISFSLKTTDDPSGELALQYGRDPQRGVAHQLVEVWERAEFAVALCAVSERQAYLIDHMFWDFRFHCMINRSTKSQDIDWTRTWMGAKRTSAALPMARGYRTANLDTPDWKKRYGQYDGW